MAAGELTEVSGMCLVHDYAMQKEAADLRRIPTVRFVSNGDVVGSSCRYPCVTGEKAGIHHDQIL